MKTHNMRRHITLYLLGVSALMAVIYGFLMNSYLINGLEAAASFEMRLEATRIAEAYEQEEPLEPLSPFITVYKGRDNLPEKLQLLFPEGDDKHLKLYIAQDPPQTKKGDERDFYLSMPYYLDDGRQLLLVKHFKKEYLNIVDPPDIDLLRFMAIPLGIGFVLTILLAVRAMFNKLYKPMDALTTWAGNLDTEKLSRPIPNFGYQEINNLAALIHRSMKGLTDSLEREQHFVKHASHELRTPLAVIQSNLELLNRMHTELQKHQRVPFERIRRATVNMNKTTETLLWLCLDDNRIPEPEAVALDVMARDLVTENRYLLDGKQVGVELNIEPSQVTTLAHGARIAMGNLIRNSFQYTAEGIVTIEVKDKTITVTNVNRTPHHIDTIGSDYGFGLGLILVEQITQKAGWQYSNQEIPGGRKATIIFCSAGQEKQIENGDLLIPGFRNIFR